MSVYHFLGSVDWVLSGEGEWLRKQGEGAMGLRCSEVAKVRWSELRQSAKTGGCQALYYHVTLLVLDHLTLLEEIGGTEYLLIIPPTENSYLLGTLCLSFSREDWRRKTSSFTEIQMLADALIPYAKADGALFEVASALPSIKLCLPSLSSPPATMAPRWGLFSPRDSQNHAQAFCRCQNQKSSSIHLFSTFVPPSPVQS